MSQSLQFWNSGVFWVWATSELVQNSSGPNTIPGNGLAWAKSSNVHICKTVDPLKKLFIPPFRNNMYICQYKYKFFFFCQFALIIAFAVQEMRLLFGEGTKWHHALSFQLFYKETEGGLNPHRLCATQPEWWHLHASSAINPCGTMGLS